MEIKLLGFRCRWMVSFTPRPL